MVIEIWGPCFSIMLGHRESLSVWRRVKEKEKIKNKNCDLFVSDMSLLFKRIKTDYEVATHHFGVFFLFF